MAQRAPLAAAPARDESPDRPAQPRAVQPTRAAILALQRSAGNRAVSRWVGQRAGPTGWRFYSSFEPDKLYATEAEAEKADRRLEAAREDSGSAELRHFTLFTYTHTPSDRALGLAAQGPHTVSHVNVAWALDQQKTLQALGDVFEEQVPSPEEFTRLLDDERSEGDNESARQYARVVGDYRRIYASAQRAFASEGSLEYARQLVGGLMNLHPYATYKWKSAGKAASGSLAGKAERWWKWNLDRPKKAWRLGERAERFYDMREIFWRRAMARGGFTPGVNPERLSDASAATPSTRTRLALGLAATGALLALLVWTFAT